MRIRLFLKHLLGSSSYFPLPNKAFQFSQWPFLSLTHVKKTSSKNAKKHQTHSVCMLSKHMIRTNVAKK